MSDRKKKTTRPATGSVDRPNTSANPRPMTGKALTDKERAEYKEAFKMFDKNGDGKISGKDLHALLKGFGYDPSKSEIKDMIANVDRDGSSTIDFEEFLVMMLKQGRTNDDRGAEMRAAFQVFDKNDDNFISRTELKSAMKRMGEPCDDKVIDQMIKASDLDKDGKINYNEFVTALFM